MNSWGVLAIVAALIAGQMVIFTCTSELCRKLEAIRAALGHEEPKEE